MSVHSLGKIWLNRWAPVIALAEAFGEIISQLMRISLERRATEGHKKETGDLIGCLHVQNLLFLVVSARFKQELGWKFGFNRQFGSLDYDAGTFWGKCGQKIT